RAIRAVTGLSPTSTMRLAPASSKWVKSFGMDRQASQRILRMVQPRRKGLLSTSSRLEFRRLGHVGRYYFPAFAVFTKRAEILRRVGELQLGRVDRFAAGGVGMHSGVENAAG